MKVSIAFYLKHMKIGKLFFGIIDQLTKAQKYLKVTMIGDLIIITHLDIHYYMKQETRL